MIGPRRAASLLSLAFLAGGCGLFHHANAASPTIDSLRPDSVFVAPGAVVEIVVQGHGFAPGTPGRNTVRFGAARLTNVPASDDGRVIRVVVPDRVPSGGEAAPLPLETGRYDIRVETPAGTSNAMVVRVFR
ncbi:MAG TPA: hypothetical protein VI259_11580 [Gemmatimonadaceae bacterium]